MSSEAQVLSFASAGTTISPYEMALDLCAVFTEFPPGAPERSQSLYEALDGEGRTYEPKLVWLLASSAVCRANFADLIFTLIDEGLLSDFFADDAAIRHLTWGMVAGPCCAYVEISVRRRAEAEQFARQQRLALHRRSLNY